MLIVSMIKYCVYKLKAPVTVPVQSKTNLELKINSLVFRSLWRVATIAKSNCEVERSALFMPRKVG